LLGALTKKYSSLRSLLHCVAVSGLAGRDEALTNGMVNVEKLAT